MHCIRCDVVGCTQITDAGYPEGPLPKGWANFLMGDYDMGDRSQHHLCPTHVLKIGLAPRRAAKVLPARKPRKIKRRVKK